MFGIRSPVQKAMTSDKSPRNPKSPEGGERRSIGLRIDEWETSKGKTIPSSTKLAAQTVVAAKPTTSQAGKTTSPGQCQDRSAEAKACLLKAKLHLSNSGNIKREIKIEVTAALDKLYQLVKDAEMDRKKGKSKEEKTGDVGQRATDRTFTVNPMDANTYVAKMEEHAKLLQESKKIMGDLKEAMEKAAVTAASYASVAAIQPAATNEKPEVMRQTLHSVVITSKDECETGEKVLDRVRKAVDAKEGWIEVKNVRKAKDRKVIIGLGTKAERDKLKNRLEKAEAQLHVEEVENRDPLMMLRSVLTIHSDEDILKALRNQNRDIFRDLCEGEDRVVIRYRRRARNPHTNHVVVSVSPTVWQRATGKGSVHIDLRRIKVEDQSPLVQCTRCLGYGHSKRFCVESVDLCSHCGGPHLKTECSDWLAKVPPKCRNCTKADIDNAEHNAFDSNCQVRKRWDDLARSTVAYC